MTKTTADILAAASSAALRTPELAAELDAADDLASLRGEFILPTNTSIGASLAAQSRRKRRRRVPASFRLRARLSLLQRMNRAHTCAATR